VKTGIILTKEGSSYSINKESVTSPITFLFSIIFLDPFLTILIYIVLSSVLETKPGIGLVIGFINHLLHLIISLFLIFTLQITQYVFLNYN
jgi:hypothetical protein